MLTVNHYMILIFDSSGIVLFEAKHSALGFIALFMDTYLSNELSFVRAKEIHVDPKISHPSRHTVIAVTKTNFKYDISTSLWSVMTAKETKDIICVTYAPRTLARRSFEELPHL